MHLPHGEQNSFQGIKDTNKENIDNIFHIFKIFFVVKGVNSEISSNILEWSIYVEVTPKRVLRNISKKQQKTNQEKTGQKTYAFLVDV